jgi:tetratricopeptide (TPR) repeat protein
MKLRRAEDPNSFFQNTSNAIEDMTKVIQLAPDAAQAYLTRGLLYMIWNDDMALRDFNRAIELSNQNAEAYYQRGLLYLRTAKMPQAQKDLAAAARLNPELKPEIDKALGK